MKWQPDNMKPLIARMPECLIARLGGLGALAVQSGGIGGNTCTQAHPLVQIREPSAFSPQPSASDPDGMGIRSMASGKRSRFWRYILWFIDKPKADR